MKKTCIRMMYTIVLIICMTSSMITLHSLNFSQFTKDGDYLWFGTVGPGAGGVFKLNTLTHEMINYSPANSLLPGYYGCSIAKDLDGSKWFATDQGLVHLNGTDWTVYDSSNSSLPEVWCLYVIVDQNGNKWVATWGGGVYKFDGVTWTNYNTSNSSLPFNNVWCLFEDHLGRIWMGTGGFFGTGLGLAVLDGNNWTVYNTANTPFQSNSIVTIKEDTQNRMWIGTWNGGMAILDNDVWNAVTEDTSPLPDDDICSFLIDPDGSTWIGTEGGGLAHVLNYDGPASNWTIYNENNSGLISNSCLYGLGYGANGDIWIGTWDGLVRFDGTNWYPMSIVATDDEIQPITNLTLTNYPNPFKPETTVSYKLKQSGQTELNIYNIRGQLVRKLVNEPLPSGQHTVTWDGKDDNGKSLASGMYLCRISSAGKQETHKMLLMK